MSSNRPQQQPGNPVSPFYRPYPTYVNHISDLLRGPLASHNGVNANSSTTSSPAPSNAFDTTSRHPPCAPQIQIQSAQHRHTHSAQERATSDLKPDDFTFQPRNGPNWSADQRRHFIIESMMIQYPPNTKGAAKTRTWSDPKAENLQGFSQELDSIVNAKHEKTERYEEFHVEWTKLQNQLHKKAAELRKEYADLVEQVRSVHHKYIRDRIKKDDYTLARKALTDQMDDVFEDLGKIVFTLGTMFSESRAVAQGANPTGDFNYGKLDVAACTAVPYLKHEFPEFVKKKPSTIPPDPFGPNPIEIAFKHDLPSYDFDEMMATVWRKHPTKLQDIHQAVFKNCFVGIQELTQKEKDNANALLGNGGEWSM